MTNKPNGMSRVSEMGWLVLVAGTLVGVAGGGEPIPTRYNGSHNLEWHEWRNWDNLIVPNNTATEQWAVTIPRSETVNLEWWGETEVSSVLLERSAVVKVNDGIFRPGAMFFTEHSVLYAAGGDVELTTTQGDWRWMKIQSQQGSMVTSNLGVVTDCRQVSIDVGSGGSLDMSLLHTVVGDDPDALFDVLADGDGAVDLSGLNTVGVLSGWRAEDGGSIELGLFNGEGAGWIHAGHDAHVSMPGVQQLDGVTIEMRGNGVITTAPLLSMDDIRFRAEEGANAVIPVGQITVHAGIAPFVIGYGATVTAPSLTTLSLEGEASMKIEASYGHVDMPQLTEITGPDGNIEIRIVTGSWNVPNLGRIEPSAYWHISGGTHSFRPMEMGPIDRFVMSIADVHFAGDLDLTGTYVVAGGGATLQAGRLVSMDGAHFEVTSGTVLAPQVESFTTAGSEWQVRDAGSVLDMSALTTMRVLPGGVLNASVRSGGTLKIGSPSIVTEGDAYVSFLVANPGSSIVFDEATDLSGNTWWEVENGGVIQTPAEVQIPNARRIALDGGVLNLPGLLSLDNAIIFIRSATQWSYGAAVETMTNTSWDIARTPWTIPGVTWVWTVPGDQKPLLVERTSVAAPDLRVIDVNPPGGGAGGTILFNAITSAMVDLSHVETVHGPRAASGHAVKFAADRNNSTMDLSGVTHADGVIHLLAVNYNAVVRWGADILVQSDGGSLEGNAAAAGQEGTLVCGGSFRTEGPVDALSQFYSGTLSFCSAAEPVLELTMFDSGANAAMTGLGVGQLIVGTDTCPTRLKLVDDADNGRRGPEAEPESIYVGRTSNFTFAQSLRIGSGSALVLNGFNLYVFNDSHVPVNISDVGPVGVRAFEYDGGKIYRVDPETCPADFRAPFGHLDFYDVQEFLGLFSERDVEADLASDGVFDFFDVQVFLNSYAGGCP